MRTPGRLARDNAARNPQRTVFDRVGAHGRARARHYGDDRRCVAQGVGEGAGERLGNRRLLRGDRQRLRVRFQPHGRREDCEGADGRRRHRRCASACSRSKAPPRTSRRSTRRRLTQLFDIGLTSGGFDRLDDTSVLMYKDPARDLKLKVGDDVAIGVLAHRHQDVQGGGRSTTTPRSPVTTSISTRRVERQLRRRARPVRRDQAGRRRVQSRARAVAWLRSCATSHSSNSRTGPPSPRPRAAKSISSSS